MKFLRQLHLIFLDITFSWANVVKSNIKCFHMEHLHQMLPINLSKFGANPTVMQSKGCNCGEIPSYLEEFMFDQHTERKLTIPQYVPPTGTEVATTIPTLQSSGDATYQPNPSELQDDFLFESQGYEEAATTVPNVQRHCCTGYTTPKFAMMCDRFGVSNRLASCLASALSEDIGFKDDHGETVVVDKRKMSREREKGRNECNRKRYAGESLHAFSFDGRKNDALTREKIGEIYHSRMHKEPHLVVVREPNSSSLGYVNLEGRGESAKAK